ncbi:hypothetical protein [Acidovorax sp. MR-S7]|uniref:hypothetical protein n=1 Tax=Acidovorax sp. MR-S7 TaxID=1268622 RepID=UPI00037FA019|nr:hypothetical protein [Acidovorax sp. MR-S7]GAD23525.1 hypothetical protein AVS7_03285 [Acidovorax sp. MR-S7]
MPPHRLSLLLAAVCLPLAALAAGAGHGQTAAERALETAPGPWQGNWRVTRDDPRMRTRAGAELARLHIIQEQGSRVLELQWTAGRAMCEDPAGEPCEWAGAAGESAHARQTQGGGLTAPLAVSADPDDPFTLHFVRRPKAGEAVQGTLSSTRGDIRWHVRIERDAQ